MENSTWAGYSAGVTATLARGIGVLLLVASVFAATNSPSIFYHEFHTEINGEWNCGNVLSPAEITDELGQQVGAQGACDEQILFRAGLAVVALVLGGVLAAYGVIRMRHASPNDPTDAVALDDAHTAAKDNGAPSPRH